MKVETLWERRARTVASRRGDGIDSRRPAHLRCACEERVRIKQRSLCVRLAGMRVRICGEAGRVDGYIEGVHTHTCCSR